MASIKLVAHCELTVGHEHEHVRDSGSGLQSPNDGPELMRNLLMLLKLAQKLSLVFPLLPFFWQL